MSYLSGLYDKKKKYEDLRPTLVICKDQLERAKGWLDDVLGNMKNTLSIDKKGYGEETFKTQKKNIERQVKSVDNAITKLDKNYRSVCNEISKEEERIRREQQAAAARSTASTSKNSGSGSSSSSGGSSNSGKSGGGKSGGGKSGGSIKSGFI